MNKNNYAIIIPSFRFDLASECQKNILPLESYTYDGTGYESFSKLINHCVVKCDK